MIIWDGDVTTHQDCGLDHDTSLYILQIADRTFWNKSRTSPILNSVAGSDVNKTFDIPKMTFEQHKINNGNKGTSLLFCVTFKKVDVIVDPPFAFCAFPHQDFIKDLHFQILVFYILVSPPNPQDLLSILVFYLFTHK